MPRCSFARRSFRQVVLATLPTLFGATFLLGGGCNIVISDLGLDILFPEGSIQITESGVDVQAPGVSIVVDAD